MKERWVQRRVYPKEKDIFVHLRQEPFRIITGKTLDFTSNEKLNEFDINISYILFKAISTHIKTSLNN